MEALNPYMEPLIFIKNNVENNSTILFIDTKYYQFGKSFLYPDINSYYTTYSTDENFLQYIRQNHIDYIFIINREFPLSSNTTLFTKIEYDSDMYLLKINRAVL